jgi:hypothetical protein
MGGAKIKKKKTQLFALPDFIFSKQNLITQHNRQFCSSLLKDLQPRSFVATKRPVEIPLKKSIGNAISPSIPRFS